MNEFIDALLSLAKVSQTELHVESVDLSALARDLLSDLQAQSPERAMHVVIQDGMVAQGDARLLKVVMENLIGNAWKFSGKKERGEISITALDVSGDTVYCVSDNGAGFDMEYADKLFGNFQRLHSHAEFPGTGIGLVNVRRIVERHGGRIWATAVEGQGATFRFTLARPAPHAS
jgi:light-regulated signal transduction histidine kinase (bacteriophytochrome)